MLTPEQLRKLLGLVPLDVEGGYFRETYRSEETIAPEALPGRYGGPRAFGTAFTHLLYEVTGPILRAAGNRCST